jgi:hypothetical protein
MRTVNVTNWTEFRNFVGEDLQFTRTYWRGQRDPSWPLASTYERTILDLEGGTRPGASKLYPYDGRYMRNGEPIWRDNFYRRERDGVLADFRRLAQGRRGPAPVRLGDLEMWAIARHYGATTPYLDWSERPYVAAFFVLADLLDDIYAQYGGLNLTGGQCAVYRLIDKGGQLDGDGLRVVKVLIDELQHLHRQHGVFTWLDSDRFFELQGFLENHGKDDFLTQVLLPDHAVVEGLRDLLLHGIDYSVLFPDLRGAALHASWMHRYRAHLFV